MNLRSEMKRSMLTKISVAEIRGILRLGRLRQQEQEQNKQIEQEFSLNSSDMEIFCSQMKLLQRKYELFESELNVFLFETQINVRHLFDRLLTIISGRRLIKKMAERIRQFFIKANERSVVRDVFLILLTKNTPGKMHRKFSVLNRISPKRKRRSVVGRLTLGLDRFGL